MRHEDHDDGLTREARTGDRDATGTAAGASVTSAMTGTDGRHVRDGAVRDDAVRDDAVRDDGLREDAGEEVYEQRVRPAVYKPARTSVVAAFALAVGVAALLCGLTGILAPVAVVLGIIGIVLGVIGMKMGRRLGITGRGVAIAGLVTSLLGLLLGAAVLAGLAVYLNDQGLDRIQQQIDNARADLPSGSDVVNQVPGR